MYYLCKPLTSDLKEWVKINPCDFTDLTIKKLTTIGFKFITEYFDNDFIYTDKIKECVDYDDLSYLVEDFLFTLCDSDEDELKTNFDILINDFVVFQKKGRYYNLVDNQELEKIYISEYSDITEFIDENLTIGMNMSNFECVFTQLIGIFSSVMTGDFAYVTCMTEDSISPYNMCIMKENGHFHNRIKSKVNNIEILNGLCYEHSVDDLKDYIGMSVMMNKTLAISISTQESCIGTPIQDSYFKKYGICLIPKNCQVNLIRLSANDVKNVFVSTSAQKNITKEIYCGEKEDDIIYGFNLIN